MAITKIQLHGVADTAGELEEVFHRLGRGMTQFVADKTADSAEGWEPMRDKDGNVQYALSDLKFTPKLNQVIRGTVRDYVVGHATYTVWHG